MGNKIASVLACVMLTMYAAIATGIVIIVQPASADWFGFVGYGIVYVAIPMICAIGIWYRERWALPICIVFWLSQTVKPLGGDQWFPYMPPITLGYPVGDVSQGAGFLINAFAIIMALGFALMLWKNPPEKHTPPRRRKRRKAR